MPSLLPTFTTLLRLFSLLSVLTISSLAGLLYTYQGKLIYPSSLPPGSREDKTRPDAFRLPFEEEWLSTPDGEKLHAWYIGDPPEKKEKGVEKKRVVIIMFQANAGNMAHRLPIADVLFRKLGCEVVMFSYRGYGLSSGTPSERGIQVDAQVVLDWVRRKVKEEEGGGGAGGETKIVLYGQSLGGAVAISTASRNSSSINSKSSSTTPGISALILENTFTSIPALIPSVLPPARFFTFLCRETWHSDLALSSVDPRMAILFLSGAKDELIPPRMMRELWGIAKRKAKGGGAREWVSLEKGTHNDTCMQRGYWGAVASFLQRRVGLATDYSRQAVQAGYSEERMCVGPQVDGLDGEKGELVAEGSSDEEEEKYGDDWSEDKVEASSTAAKAASAAGVRKRGGAGGAGPADVVDEEIETDGVRSARLGKL